MQLSKLAQTQHDYCLWSISPNSQAMQQDLKKLETAVIRTMITAHAAYYGRALTESETADSKATIRQLLEEITSRHEIGSKLLTSPSLLLKPVAGSQ
jgi:hypothetical protein